MEAKIYGFTVVNQYVFVVDLDYDDIDLEDHTLAFHKDNNQKVCYTGKYYILS